MLTLLLLPYTLAVCRLANDEPIPGWSVNSAFFSITRTPDELSIVCLQRDVPDGVRHEGGWRCLKVEGPLDFALVGILASLVGPLAEAGISIFALSTYDMDYLLVKAHDVERAIDTLSQAGHHIRRIES